MSVKIISVRRAFLAVMLMLSAALCGCSPNGPGALLKGRARLERGDYTAAVADFRIATTLMPTNAAAWNYYGVALQGASHPNQAVNAYQRALELDRDLIEARLNLGMLYLEQNKPSDAKTEFTTYTLRRPNDPEGWLKLGSAQLRLKQTIAAERSFSAVLALKTNQAEAYNGLGLARVQRSKPGEAAQFFAAAVRLKPNFAAALLNLATVYDQYLHNDRAALQCYRAYLKLTPKPANWNEVNALVNNLERSLSLGKAGTTRAPAPAPVPAVRPNQQAPPATTTVAKARPRPKPTRPAPVHVLQSPHARSEERARPRPHPRPSRHEPSAPAQSVRVTPEPRIVTRPEPAAETTAQSKPHTPPPRETAAQTRPVRRTNSKPKQSPRGLSSSHQDNYARDGVTPLPSATVSTSHAKPVEIVPPAPINFPRYNYLSPARPKAGNRRAASGAFTQARLAEQNQNWQAALNGYREAARLDPSWFEAQYNAGVIAQRLQNFDAALQNYEMALAIRPKSVDARYNFALALNAAGYVPDAASQLKKLLTEQPKNARAHLALANICAQSLHDPVQARQQYLKVLQLDPDNPKAAQIRYWLTQNPE